MKVLEEFKTKSYEFVGAEVKADMRNELIV
jgi:hypothetical protein